MQNGESNKKNCEVVVNMSDNEDLLGDDLGDHSLADYNLGNDEEDQLLADDFEGSSTQNVPSTLPSFREPEDIVPSDYSGHGIEYTPQPAPYQPTLETESVVPNIVVEVPNLPPAHSTYAPYEPRHYEAEHSVPAAMPAAPTEPPQTVPSEIMATIPNDMSRERFISERPVGAQRLPQIRDIPDSLDKVVIAGGGPRRGAWRPHLYTRTPHPYRRNNMHRANFQRNSFPPQQVRPLPPPPQMPDIRLDPLPPPQLPNIRLETLPHAPLPNIRLEIANDIRPPFQPDRDLPRPMEARPPLNLPRQPMDLPRPPMGLPRPGLEMNRPPFQPFQRFPFREERPMFNQVRPPFERPVYFPRQQYPRFGPPMPAKEPEVLMLPVNIPPGIAPKKVLINPHFKGTFQPPVEGLSIPTYIPTRIQKPPLSPTLENKFGPIKDIDDAAERFIAEQRNALARAANRKVARRSPPPQRYIEDTTIEIENELARRPARRRSEDDLLRRQEEFIHANRAGLRRRMRSPSPPPAAPRRSASPPARRDDRDRRRPTNDEDSEYKRKVREQESMRERVLRAKEVRRRKNAAAYIKQMQDKEKEEKEQQHQKEPPKEPKPSETIDKPAKTEKPVPKRREAEPKPDTTRLTPERGATPRPDTGAAGGEVNSTSGDTWTPPRVATPPAAPLCSDDELDLILGDIDGILSSDDELKEDKPKPKPEPPKPKVTDLRTRLPPKSSENKKPRQKITFNEEKEDKKKKEKSPPRKAVVSSTKTDDSEPDKKSAKTKQKQDASSNKSRQRIIFENESAKQPDKPKPEKSSEKEKPSACSNRRVVLNQRKKETKSVFSRIEITNDPTKPNPGIFSRAVRTITERPDDARRPDDRTNRIVIRSEPEVEYDSSGDEADEVLGSTALVENLPHGMTDTRLKTLAGDVQSLSLDKENRTAKITFKATAAAESFKKKFNNKMVAASRLTVTLQ